MSILGEEAELQEIVKLVGMDALSSQDRLKLEVARSIREDFLHQNAFHNTDTFTSLRKQYLMLNLILEFYNVATNALVDGADIDDILNFSVREKIGRFKYLHNEKIESEYEDLIKELAKEAEDSVREEEV